MKTRRQRIIFRYLTDCNAFGDVGCDHGVFTYEMLAAGKAKRAVYSDISAACLEKARALLAPFESRATGVVCDGITSAHAPCDQILIAGMGGMEMVKIVRAAPSLPARLVLQPMKDAEAVRKTVDSLGYAIETDTLFTAEGKYYYLITAKKRADEPSFSGGRAQSDSFALSNGSQPPYTAREYRYGRDNLRDMQPDFVRLLEVRKAELVAAVARAKETEPLRAELAEIEEILQNGTHQSH